MKRVIRLYYGFTFLFSLLLWVPIFYEFQRRVGLSEAQIFSLQSLYYFAFCFFEIPTGYISDRFGHRASLRLGGVLLALGNLLPVLGVDYSWFAAHFLLVALARSLVSGAASAYVYDALQAEGQGAHYRRIEGNARAMSLAGKVLFWAGVGAAMEWHLSLPYALTALASAGSALLAWMLPADSAQSSQEDTPGPVQTFLAISRSWPVLLFMIQGLSIFVLSRICQINLFQPLLLDRGLSVASLGFVMGLITLAEALGSARPQWVRRWAGDTGGVFVLTVVIAISLSVMAASSSMGAVLALVVLSFATGLAYPIQRQLLNDAISGAGLGAIRATALSVESIFDRAVSGTVALVLGPVLAMKAMGTFLYGSAVLSIVAAVVILFWIRNLRLATAAADTVLD
ncbi:MAG: hypothetical protein A2X94_11430 [Bdellovibrionales bacterium GWB1_55_8]|nr:MAG: hypothetical protein A2X94_11430 [Bdellovibrionales bacterium GWB1_55_8]